MTMDVDGNLMLNGMTNNTGGKGVVGIPNATVNPFIHPVGGGCFFIDGVTHPGDLWFYGSGGTFTKLAVA
jgi:hypothetical protein